MLNMLESDSMWVWLGPVIGGSVILVAGAIIVTFVLVARKRKNSASKEKPAEHAQESESKSLKDVKTESPAVIEMTEVAIDTSAIEDCPRQKPEQFALKVFSHYNQVLQSIGISNQD